MVDNERVRLDVAQSAASAYLDVLRAKTFERIERVNLEVSRENLELARVREAIGQAGPEEVYRWESAIQKDREVVMIAKTTQNCLPRLIDTVNALHSYDCPCIVSFDIDGGQPAFLDWIGNEVRET